MDELTEEYKDLIREEARLHREIKAKEKVLEGAGIDLYKVNDDIEEELAQYVHVYSNIEVVERVGKRWS